MLNASQVAAMVGAAEADYLKSCNSTIRTTGGPATKIDDLLARRSLRGPHNDNATIEMTMNEALLVLDLLLASSAYRYIEWGSGGSTELVSWLSVSRQLANPGFRAYSIESSADWIQYMHSRSQMVTEANGTGALIFTHADIGPTGHLGFPKRMPTRRLALRYIAPRSIADMDRRADVILIDGRFRLSCAYSAVLQSHRDSTILMHDFGPPMIRPTRPGPLNAAHRRRREYEQLLREGHFTLERLVQSLAVLRLRYSWPLSPGVVQVLRERRDHWAKSAS